MQIELTRDEAQQLFQIIDIAVKAAGVQVAKAAVHFAEKIDAAVRAEDAAASNSEASK
jgi:hypothetical protein